MLSVDPVTPFDILVPEAYMIFLGRDLCPWLVEYRRLFAAVNGLRWPYDE